MKPILILLLPIAGLLSINKLNKPFNLNGISNAYPIKDTNDTLLITKTTGYEAKTTGISFARIETYLDSSYYPRSLYYNIRFAEVLGAVIQEVGPTKFTVKLLNEKKEDIPLLKQPKSYVAKTFKDGEEKNILLSIPLNPIDVNNKNYFYHLIFETSAGKQIITMSGKVGYK